MYFLEDRAPGSFDPVVVTAGIAALVAIAVGVWQRREVRRRPRRGSDYQVFRADAAEALRAWGLVQLVASLVWLGSLPRLDMPLWSYLAAGLGIVTLLVGLWRWRFAPWWSRPLERAPGREGDGGLRAESQTWEFALIGAASAFITTYVVGLVIPVHPPVHLIVSLLEGWRRVCAGTDALLATYSSGEHHQRRFRVVRDHKSRVI